MSRGAPSVPQLAGSYKAAEPFAVEASKVITEDSQTQECSVGHDDMWRALVCVFFLLNDQQCILHTRMDAYLQRRPHKVTRSEGSPMGSTYLASSVSCDVQDKAHHARACCSQNHARHPSLSRSFVLLSSSPSRSSVPRQ